jgi:hypothetical protein
MGSSAREPARSNKEETATQVTSGCRSSSSSQSRPPSEVTVGVHRTKPAARNDGPSPDKHANVGREICRRKQISNSQEPPRRPVVMVIRGGSLPGSRELPAVGEPDNDALGGSAKGTPLTPPAEPPERLGTAVLLKAFSPNGSRSWASTVPSGAASAKPKADPAVLALERTITNNPAYQRLSEGDKGSCQLDYLASNSAGGGQGGNVFVIAGSA